MKDLSLTPPDVSKDDVGARSERIPSPFRICGKLIPIANGVQCLVQSLSEVRMWMSVAQLDRLSQEKSTMYASTTTELLFVMDTAAHQQFVHYSESIRAG
jgi:hypothetical protein